MDQRATASDAYALGDTAQEHQRLIAQAARLRVHTEPWLREAGLGPGMRVLDAGCGAGDVSFLAAEIVGPGGTVVGVDRSADALRTAQRRASALGHAQVTFLEGDVGAVAPEATFDALVGRLVLAHVADPVAVLRHLAGLVRPGGVVVFHELDLAARAWPPAPLFEQCLGWVTRAGERAGSTSNMGLRLYKTFVEAGLPAPQVRIRGIASDGSDRETLQSVVELVRSVLPAMERFQVATAAEVAVETLAERLRDEVVAGGGVIYTSLHYGAWTRTPTA